MEWKPEYGTLTDELMAKVQGINAGRATEIRELKPDIAPNIDPETGQKAGVDTYIYSPPPTAHSKDQTGMSEIGR